MRSFIFRSILHTAQKVCLMYLSRLCVLSFALSHFYYSSENKKNPLRWKLWGEQKRKECFISMVIFGLNDTNETLLRINISNAVAMAMIHGQNENHSNANENGSEKSINNIDWVSVSHRRMIIIGFIEKQRIIILMCIKYGISSKWKKTKNCSMYSDCALIVSVWILFDFLLFIQLLK